MLPRLVFGFPLPLVLDTNVVRFGKVARLESLAARGFRLRISELALAEWWARTTHDFRTGRLSRQVARLKFFERARRIAPSLDDKVPIAAGLGNLSHVVRAAADSAPPPPSAVAHVEGISRLWPIILGTELGDEEWLEQGEHYERHLDALDENLRELAQRGNLLDARVPVALAEMNEKWKGLPRPEKHRLLLDHVRLSAKISEAAAERFDAYLQSTTFRLLEADSGARDVKANDGADLLMLNHLSAGCILVTRDRQATDLVDLSGTFQSPWIRDIEELDGSLPEIEPWGPEARRMGTDFTRGRERA